MVGVPKPLTRPAMVALVERLAREPVPSDPVGLFCAHHQLGPQEALLVRRTSEGRNLEAIADELGCRPTTLKTLWARIHDKTGIRTRRAVMSAAWSHGSKGR